MYICSSYPSKGDDISSIENENLESRGEYVDKFCISEFRYVPMGGDMCDASLGLDCQDWVGMKTPTN